MSKPEAERDSIEIPIPFIGKSAKFSGPTVVAIVFFAILNLGVAFIFYNQLNSIHDEIEKLRQDLIVTAREVNCKLDLDIYMYGRPPDQFRMRDMPRDLFTCLPKWVGEGQQQIAPRPRE